MALAGPVSWVQTIECGYKPVPDAFFFFFLSDAPPPEISPLPHPAPLPISSRSFSPAGSDELVKPPMRAAAKEYALAMGRAGLILSSVEDDEGVTFYPMTYTGVGGFHLWTVLKHLHGPSRKPDGLS